MEPLPATATAPSDPAEALAFARQFISEQDWYFAQSYALTHPHEWAARPKGKDLGWVPFKVMDQVIRQQSNARSLFNYKALAIDGWMYWSVWPVINRAPMCDTCGALPQQCPCWQWTPTVS